MEIRNRYYPYPVLRKDSNDYINSDFDYILNISQDKDDFILEIEFILNNEEINMLISNDFFEFLIHVECPYTNFREIYTTKNIKESFKINSNRLIKKANICVFIVAKTSFRGYSNKNFNPDYSNMSFNINRGNIIAIGGQENLDIVKIDDELENNPSIFTISKNPDPKSINDILISLDSNKITIFLSSHNYELYNTLKQSGNNNLEILNTIIIFPALIYMFEALKSSDIEDYRTYLWFKSVENAMNKNNLELTNELLSEKDSFSLSQIILNNQFSRGLESLNALNLEDDDI